MRLLNIPSYKIFTYTALSFLFGIGVGSFYLVKPDFQALTVLTMLLLFSLLCMVLRIDRLFHLGFAFFWFFSGFLYVAFSSQNIKSVELSNQEVTGTVISRVERNYKDQKFIFNINSENMDVYTTIPSFPSCNYGDSIRLTGSLRKSAGSPLANSLKARRVSIILANPSGVVCEKKKLGIVNSVKKTLYNLSFSFEESINKVISEPEASLAAGLTLGVKKNLSDEFKESLNAAGLTHIVALSGYNVTIIISVLISFLAVYLSRRQIFGIGFSLVLLFVLMTGASSSVVRAAIFSFTLLYGKLVGRKGYMPNLMLLAALIMVLFNPYLLMFDIGFQLSFLAFSGLIFVVEPLKNQFKKTRMPDFINLTLSETLGAQLFVFPIILYYFGRFSVIAPLSNLLVLWLVPWAMLFSFFVGLFGLFFFPVAKIFGIIAWLILSIMVFLTNFMAHIPFSSFEVSINNAWFLSLYGLIPLASLWQRFGKRRV